MEKTENNGLENIGQTSACCGGNILIDPTDREETEYCNKCGEETSALEDQLD